MTDYTTMPGSIAASSMASTNYDWLQSAALWFGIAGGVQQAFGAWMQADAMKGAQRSAALDAEFAGTMSDQNALTAELDAQALLRAGQDEQGRISAQYGQLQSAQQVDTAASGVQAGVGSAAEVAASIALQRRLDLQTSNRNTIRAAYQRRMQATDYRNQGLFARTSARNLRATASSIRPELSAGASLLGSASQIALMANTYYGRGPSTGYARGR